jgi:pimeloyl-ACP methyl ester carboxylesterase
MRAEMCMRLAKRNRKLLVIGVVAAALLATEVARSQAPAAPVVDEKVLREYEGTYRWTSGESVYVQLWDEFTGFGKPKQLVAFEESGAIRTLYPADRGQFFAGPSAAVSTSVESRIDFGRDSAGNIISMTWRRDGGAVRTAQRVDIEKHEDVSFSNGDIRLAGTLISPRSGGKHPVIILVHGSGAEDRQYMLPWARFLIRRGIAVLGYDKRGVGQSTGDWNTATLADLAGDAVAAFNYLKARGDVDGTQIGLLGISQAGWIMPLAAVDAKEIAFLISISGAGVPVAETTLDQARNEMTMGGMPTQMVDEIIGLLKLQYEYARTGNGWDEYAKRREQLAAKMGPPPDTIPGSPDAPYWGFIRRIYFYDPVPTLRQLQTPTLALWGELDNNVLAEKNKAAWEAALKAAGNHDYTLRILPKANHAQWEAKIGSNAEMKTVQRFVPEYFSTIREWLAKRVRGFDGA